MDIHCKFCGEPWEHDTLHEFGDYKNRAKLFAQLGCNALMDDGNRDYPCNTGVVDPDMAWQAGFLQEWSDHPEEWVADGLLAIVSIPRDRS